MSKSSAALTGVSPLRRVSVSPNLLSSPVLPSHGGNLSPPASPKASEIPLRAWPPHYCREVPEILGLDEYNYKVGARSASRAKTRFMQACQEEAARKSSTPSRRRPQSGTSRPKSASGSFSVRVAGSGVSAGVKERVVEAGGAGSAVILWNRSGKSTDYGAWQLDKRRQKLTDDLLREVVVFFGDPLDVVADWFRVFEFHCDRPVDMTLPELPASADDEAELPRSARPSSPASPGQPPASGRSASAACLRPGAGGRCASRRAPAQGAAARLRLRRQAVPRCPPRVQVSDDAWEERQKEVKGQLAKHKVGQAWRRGPLDLTSRCAEEVLEPEDLEVWAKRYEASKAHPLVQSPARSRARSTDVTSMRVSTVEHPGVKRLINFDNLAVALDKLTYASCASSEEGARSRGLSGSDFDEEAEASPESVMLRSASCALLGCGLLQKGRAPGQEKAAATRAEVLQERSRIFRSVAPVEMSLNNLSRALSCFGIARRNAVERVCSYLKQGVSRVVAEEAVPRHSEGDLPFVVFYRLMRALHGGRRPSGRRRLSQHRALGGQRDRDDAPAGDAAQPAEWPESELLRRLLFAVLVGWVGPAPLRSAPERQLAYSSQVALSVAGLQGTLSMLLCTPVLLEVDVHGAGGATDAPGNAGPALGAPGTELRSLAMFLHAELVQAEMEEAESSASTSATSGFVTFNGFERFVRRFPKAFTGLVLLLMPLAARGGDYLAQEVEIGSRKGSMHRAGELRATINAQTQFLQRRHLDALHRNFVQPWLAARAGIGGDSPAAASGCGGAAERALGGAARRA